MSETTLMVSDDTFTEKDLLHSMRLLRLDGLYVTQGPKLGDSDPVKITEHGEAIMAEVYGACWLRLATVMERLKDRNVYGSKVLKWHDFDDDIHQREAICRAWWRLHEAGCLQIAKSVQVVDQEA